MKSWKFIKTAYFRGPKVQNKKCWTHSDEKAFWWSHTNNTAEIGKQKYWGYKKDQYTRGHKKCGTLLLSISSPIIDRFL